MDKNVMDIAFCTDDTYMMPVGVAIVSICENNKAEDISETINYEDHFINKNTFNWMSRNNRKTSSPELEPLINYNGMDIELFIQKNNDESCTV